MWEFIQVSSWCYHFSMLVFPFKGKVTQPSSLSLLMEMPLINIWHKIWRKPYCHLQEVMWMGCGFLQYVISYCIYVVLIFRSVQRDTFLHKFSKDGYVTYDNFIFKGNIFVWLWKSWSSPLAFILVHTVLDKQSGIVLFLILKIQTKQTGLDSFCVLLFLLM